MRIFIILSILIFTNVEYIYSQQFVEVFGVITNQKNEPLVGVSVTVEGKTLGTSTNENGEYRLGGLSPEYQTLVFSYIGFKTVKESIDVRQHRKNHKPFRKRLDIVLEEEGIILQEVEVIGRKENSYKNTISFIGTKTATMLKDVPQSVGYVTKELVLDQGASTVNDVVKNISGVNQYTSYNDFSIRGFRTTGNRNSGNMVNGMRAQTSLWKQSSLANIERVEIIKGPASVLFGNASPGGIINRVTKKPLLEAQNVVSTTIGSFNTIKTYADFTAPLNKQKTFLYRLNLGYENTDSFRDLQQSENIIVAPSFSFLPTEKTRLNVDLFYQKMNGKVDRGQTIFGDDDLYSVPITQSLSASNDFLKEVTANFTIGLTHKFTDNFSFNATYLNSSYSENLQEHNQANSYYLQERNNASSGDQSKVLMQALLRNRFFRNNSFNNYFNYNFATGFVKHTLLLGYDYFQTDLSAGSSQLTAGGYLLKDGTTNVNYTPANISKYVVDANGNPKTNVPLFDLNNPSAGNGIRDISKYIFSPGSLSPYRQYSHGVYLQEQIDIEIVKLLIGLRKEYFIDYLNYKTKEEIVVRQQAFLPRIGLVISVSPNVNLYSTWVKGFETQSAAIQSDAERYGGPFDPIYSELYEIGTKTDWFNQRLSATISIFDIIQKNTLYDAPIAGKPDWKTQIGEERSRGVELDIAGQILPNWNLVVNYAYTDARITKTASNSEKDFDMQRPSTPRHAGNIWTKYIITEGIFKDLGLGVGCNFVTERYGQVGRRTNTVVYPQYELLNAVLYYKVKDIQLQINVNNLLNKTHWVGGYDKLRSFPGAPRNVNATVSYRF